MKQWNPRYVAYAAVHGLDPESMLHYDKERFPGGCMMEFSFWIQARWDEFCREFGYSRYYAPWIPEETEKFDKWLQVYVRP